MSYYLTPIEMATENVYHWEFKETRNLVHCCWDCKMVQILWKEVSRCLKHLKQLPYDPAIPLLAIYPKELKSGSQRNTWTLMFIATWNSVGKGWKQSQCPSVDEWINKMLYMCTVEYYLVLKRKSPHMLQHGWNLRT